MAYCTGTLYNIANIDEMDPICSYSNYFKPLCNETVHYCSETLSSNYEEC